MQNQLCEEKYLVLCNKRIKIDIIKTLQILLIELSIFIYYNMSN